MMPSAKQPKIAHTAAGSTKRDRNQLKVKEGETESLERTMAKLALCPLAPNAVTARNYAKCAFGDIDLTEAVQVVTDRARAAQCGNLADLEAMLAAQAIALNSVFNEMARRAGLNMGAYLTATDTFMRLALKAQAQCRATAQTLFEMKNPPATVAFVRQANIANGPQQVNNNIVPNAHARAGDLAGSPNELMGVAHE